jgi:hypothetical protein
MGHQVDNRSHQPRSAGAKQVRFADRFKTSTLMPQCEGLTLQIPAFAPHRYKGAELGLNERVHALQHESNAIKNQAISTRINTAGSPKFGGKSQIALSSVYE